MTERMTQLVEGQAEAATVVNENFRAVEPAACYGYNAADSNLLTFAYYGGTAYINDDYVTIANGTVTLTASTTNYIEASNSTGAVSVNTTGFTDGYLRLYEVVCDGTHPTDITDKRFNYGMFAASVVALPEFMGALVNKAAAQTTANYSTAAAVTWDEEAYDTHGFHSTASNTSRLTVPTGLGIAKVRLSGMVMSNDGTATSGQSPVAFIIKNGDSTVPWGYVGAGVNRSRQDSTSHYVECFTPAIAVSDGDYFELMFSSGGDTSITVSDESWFSIEVVEAVRLDQHRSALSTLASTAGAVTINLSAYEYFKIALTENVTSVTMAGVTSGVVNRFELRIAQGASNYSWANPGSWKFPGGSAYTPSTVNGEVDILRGRTYDGGTTWEVEFQKDYS